VVVILCYEYHLTTDVSYGREIKELGVLSQEALDPLC
jgi:hypothetical protein